MRQSPLISVILPVYNVAPYLTQCLRSLLTQTYQNLEVILIDDGSTDHSAAICRQFSQDPRVHFYQQTNRGLACTRNRGLALAHGDYLSFVDSDDWLAPDTYATLLGACHTTGADIAVCGRYLTTEAGHVQAQRFSQSQMAYNRVEAMRALLLEEAFDASLADKLFHCSCLTGIQFPAGKLHDDVGTFYQILHRSQQLVHVGRPLYYYRQRDNSISVLPLSQAKLDLLHFAQQIQYFMHQHYPQLHTETASFYYRILKNFRAQLSLHQATDPAVAQQIIHAFNQVFWQALRAPHLSRRDKLVIIANRIGCYRWLRHRQLIATNSTSK
ncbi:glycosyltransferase family 2 protein [Loigolactobacillus bifermentans]|uniref:glycosyltransferase family 2 protein n=1 Tax=Loigolactobacillus bifermentans TaxID=1607 RepID=UPI00070A4130|nr:glycosyltransferase [Loigolactobacillus bifermentans]QGG61413.1 glycosyltransferase [Loigolactobacillus bifermentans]